MFFIGSKFKTFQIIDAELDAGKWGSRRFVLLDKVVLDTRLPGRPKNLLEINRALAHFGEEMSGRGVHVFDMNQRKAPRIGGEILQRILSGFSNPVQVDLHLHQPRVCPGQYHVVWQSTLSTLYCRELEIMIVIAQLNPNFSQSLTSPVLELNEFLVVIN